MPTYGYRCQKCSHEYELWQRMTDAPDAPCPTCGGAGRRLIFPVGIVFKGSGFYATDNRARSSGGQAAKDGAAAGAPKADNTKTDGTKTETTKTEKKQTEAKAESASSSPAPSRDGAAPSSTG